MRLGRGKHKLMYRKNINLIARCLYKMQVDCLKINAKYLNTPIQSVMDCTLKDIEYIIEKIEKIQDKMDEEKENKNAMV